MRTVQAYEMEFQTPGGQILPSVRPPLVVLTDAGRMLLLVALTASVVALALVAAVVAIVPAAIAGAVYAFACVAYRGFTILAERSARRSV